MPEISNFYNIRITMYYKEHQPPHFHADYNGIKAEFDIKNACVLVGKLPGKQLKLVRKWAMIHQKELLENWNCIELKNGDIKKIEPLK